MYTCKSERENDKSKTKMRVLVLEQRRTQNHKISICEIKRTTTCDFRVVVYLWWMEIWFLGGLGEGLVWSGGAFCGGGWDSVVLLVGGDYWICGWIFRVVFGRTTHTNNDARQRADDDESHTTQLTQHTYT